MSTEADTTEGSRDDTDRRALLERVAELDCRTGENAAAMLQSLESDEEADG